MARYMKNGIVLLVLAVLLAMAYTKIVKDENPRPVVSRSKADMRSVATAIESYCVDHKSYPAWTLDPRLKASWNSESTMPTFYRSLPGGPATITTPVAYLTSILTDSHHDRNEVRTFAYWVRPDGKGWILVGAGPDKVFNLDLETIEALYDPTREDAADRLKAGAGPRGAYTYDATNGTFSPGDIWRVTERVDWREAGAEPTPEEKSPDS